MFRVEIGGTDGYGYVGVQPPLREEHTALLEPLEFTTVQSTHGDGDPWSETKFPHSLPEEYAKLSANAKILKIGHEVTQKLREGGFTVEMDETVRTLNWGRELFDPRVVPAGQLN